MSVRFGLTNVKGWGGLVFWQFSLGGCLADDMGLGKTVQVLAPLEERRLARLAGGNGGVDIRPINRKAPAWWWCRAR